MKIVIASDIYYPMINGVAAFSRNLAAGLHKRGHEILVVAPSITGKFEMETDREYGFRVARLSSVRVPVYPDQIHEVPEARTIGRFHIPQLVYKNGMRASFHSFSEVCEVLDSFKPDLIHDQTPGPVAWGVFRYAKKNDIPMVATDHAYPDNLTQQLKLPRLAKKPINKLINGYFISFLRRSEYATMPTEQAIVDLIPKNRRWLNVPVEALSNGIDLSCFSPGEPDRGIYEKYGLPENRPIILFVGRVDPEKSLEILMKAFTLLSGDVPDAHLVIVGDGTARPKLEKLAEKAGLRNRVHFTGRVVGADLPQIYRAARVFAITSRTETQSIVLLEAMATGLPCVAVEAGAIPELVKSGENGFLCTPNDAKGVAEGLKIILTDENKWKNMQSLSLQKVRRHDLRYTLARIEEIYNQVLDKYGNRTPDASEKPESS